MAQLRRAVANVCDLQKIRLCADSADAAHAAKPRDVRRNSHRLEGKNVLYIRDLVRGGESRIRTISMAVRISMKSR